MSESEARLFWGLAFSDAQQLPWSAQDDWSTWKQRYQNRAGKAPDGRCQIGVYGRLDHFSYCYVSIQESERSGNDRQATSFSFPKVPSEWAEQLREYCEILEIPWSTPQWHLVAIQHS